MHPILRTVLAVVAGTVTALLLLMAVELFSAVVHPFPEGLSQTPEEICRHVERYPSWVLAIGALMWGGAAFVSVWLTGKIGNRISAAIVGTLFLAGVVCNVAMLPYPWWFRVAAPTAALVAVAAAVRAAFGRSLAQGVANDSAARGSRD
jgi:hypothetical protein